ncbi:MAG TPA: C25 family cysteine peptidase, partial [Anaerolineae bacterium]|nr:C25 family cysteine peptidase [Anaerolineae bacterium]
MAKLAFRWLLALVCLGLVLTLALPAGADPQERWLPFDGDSAASQPILGVIGSNGEAIDLAADLPGAWTAGIQEGGRDFSRLYGDGYGHPTKVGMPDLPVFRRDVEIPFGGSVTVELVSADYAEYTLADLDLDPIYPLQPSLRKTDDAEAGATFQIEDAFYASGGLYPTSPVALGEAYTIRGHRAQPVEVWPVAYNPTAGTVRLYHKVTFRLLLSGGDLALTKAMAERHASPAFESRLAAHIANYNQGSGARQISPDESVGYLIIAADAYYDSMVPFVALKEGRGYDVTITKTSEIPNGGTTAGIKAYIQTAYDTWPVPPSFVLLVGDTNTIPTYTGPEIGTSTDLYYGCMDGSADWHPDLGRGRFPVRSAAQTTYMVDKYLAYANLTGQEPWIKATSFAATCDDYQTAEGSHNYVINNHTLPNGYTGTFPSNPQPGGDKLYCVTYGATHQDLIDAFNLGRWAIIYSGHGSYSGWEMSFTPADVKNLTNDGMFPFVASHACLSGDFGQTEVFGETWVLEPNQGALVYWGSSTYSYWGEDDVLERRMFDNLFSADPHPTIAEMTDAGLAGVETSYPSMARYYWETYNVLGDPAAKLFLEPDLPTFTLAVNPAEHEVCTSGTAHSTVTIGSIMNYNGLVSLSTGALPPGVTASFAPASAPAPYTSDLALGVAAGTPAGEYPVAVFASDGTLTLDEEVALQVRTSSPAAPVLVSPADGATDQALAPVLDWDGVQQAGSYNLQLGSSPLFADPILDVTDIADTAFATPSPLQGGACYWWHVQGENACGVGTWAEPFHFATVALANAFYDDVES